MRKPTYIVKLSKAGRERLNDLLGKEKSSAQVQLKARLLRHADSGKHGSGWIRRLRLRDAKASNNLRSTEKCSSDKKRLELRAQAIKITASDQRPFGAQAIARKTSCPLPTSPSSHISV
jgi:hypothetical protein